MNLSLLEGKWCCYDRALKDELIWFNLAFRRLMSSDFPLLDSEQVTMVLCLYQIRLYCIVVCDPQCSCEPYLNDFEMGTYS